MAAIAEGGISNALLSKEGISVQKGTKSASCAIIPLVALVVLVVTISGLVSMVFVLTLRTYDDRQIDMLVTRVKDLEEKYLTLSEKCSRANNARLPLDQKDQEDDDEYYTVEEKGTGAEGEEEEEEEEEGVDDDDLSVDVVVSPERLRRAAPTPAERRRNPRRRNKNKIDPFSKMKNSTAFKEYHPTAFHLMGNLPDLTVAQQATFSAGGDVSLSNPAGTWNKNKGYRPAPDGVYRRWKPADWSTKRYGSDYTYSAETGELTVKKGGVYFIYSQILFNNAASRSSHAVKVGNQTFMQCVQSVDYVTEGSDAKYKTCYVGGTHFLGPDTTLKVVDQYRDRWVNFDQASSYWGVIKLAGS